MIRLLISASSLLLMGFAPNAFSQADPTKVPVSFNKIYVSEGFDSNDHVQILGEGVFQNGCYRYAETKVQVDERERRIFIQPIAYKYSGYCLQVMVPFWKVFDVGILAAGRWEVFQGTTPSKLGEFNIRPALSEEADDYMYAPVSQAFYKPTANGHKVVLTGEFSNDCLSISEVKVNVQPNVIVLQPIAKVDAKASCKTGSFPFSKDVSIGAVRSGRYLLQVRSMNSNSINSLIEVR